MTRQLKTMALAALLCVTGCDEAEKLLTFFINDKTDVTISSNAPLSLPLGIPTPDVTSDSKQQYENNNTHASLVKDVKLEKMVLSITDPQTKTFSFLKSIHIYISSDQSDEIELASLEDVPPNVSEIALIPTKAKLDRYIRSSSYSLRTEVTTDETLMENVDVHVDLRFRVTADTF